MNFLFTVLIFELTISILSVNGKPHKDRIIDKELSDKEHILDEQHNSEYDHEAFLGKEDSKKFDQLSPEESKERLGKIVDKMDTDKDGKITKEELKLWIQKSSKRYLVDDRDRSWKDLSLGDDDKFAWEAYKKSILNNPEDEDDEESLKSILEKDEKRWKVADENGDGVLDKNEYLDFLHPEDSPRMRDVVIDETLTDLDKNKDGFVDLDEYMSDMWQGESGESEPEWIHSERETFNTKRDRNGDGKLDRSEVDEWILPKDYDHVESETTHLFSSADVDNDGVLSKEEILDKHELFVGSQATDFGEGLMHHDEL